MIVAIIAGAIIDVFVLYCCCVASSHADDLIEQAWKDSKEDDSSWV